MIHRIVNPEISWKGIRNDRIEGSIIHTRQLNYFTCPGNSQRSDPASGIGAIFDPPADGVWRGNLHNWDGVYITAHYSTPDPTRGMVRIGE